MPFIKIEHLCIKLFFLLRRPLSEVYVQLSAFVSHHIFLLGSNMISFMFVGPCIIVITEVKNQQDATYYFIVLVIVSTCFGHCYAHHQEIATIMSIITLVVSILGCYRLNMFRALLCPSSGVRDYNVDYHIGRFDLGLLQAQHVSGTTMPIFRSSRL